MAQTVISPEYLLAAHQTEGRIGVPSKIIDIAFFDKLDVRKNSAEIDGRRYPRDSVITNYNETDYLEQYRDLKLFFKEYVGVESFYISP